ncbi:transcriptional activator protein acu-15 [Phlyctema vagabunda]|uniref:Transcriptional activator protein acu-15 n=1 Tax=Phlyctema vagabunda TaxID=108571 RepID=A0ABR4PGS8_9HELO
MLSKMHSHRRPSISSATTSPSVESKEATPLPKDDVFRVQASPLLLGLDNADSYFMGASSGRAFIDAFKCRLQESGKSLAGFKMEAFLNNQTTPVTRPSTPTNFSAPPRMFSDRFVNVFFQEWAPLFPVLHKPTFLRLYEDFVSDPEEVTDHHKLAQLHLVFAIAGLSCDMPDQEQIASCETQWQASLDVVLMDNSLVSLQCLILAMMYSISKADYNKLQHYKCVAVGLSHRLGLHQSQKRFSFGALTTETRKRVFWTLYTLDCFSAALLGLPKLLKEEDIHAEYPSDTDDEYVTEKGFQPTLPGEYTKISSALALFRASRILSKVLDQNYPAAATHEMSLQSLASLDTELNDWSDKLPTHLKLTFVQDKPSTDVTGSRSALLSLAFYYIRSLIHRPAVGSSLGNKSSSSVISLANSSKHIIQIVQLLEERSMSFSFCLNKNEMLTLCGLTLLYQGLDLKQEGKLKQDGQRMVQIVVKYLEKANAPGAADFKKLATSMTAVSVKSPTARNLDLVSRVPTSTKSTPSPPIPKRNIQPQASRHHSSSMSQRELLSQQEKLRRATLPNISKPHIDSSSNARTSTESLRSESSLSRKNPRSSGAQMAAPVRNRTAVSHQKSNPNLDYFPLGTTPVHSQPQSPQLRARQATSLGGGGGSHGLSGFANNNGFESAKSSGVSVSEWEALLGSLDGGQTNLYDAIYGGPALSLQSEPIHAASSNHSSNYDDWAAETWDITALNVHDFTSAAGQTQSVLSFSEESLSSGEDLPTSELMGRGSGCSDPYLLDGVYGL